MKLDIYQIDAFTDKVFAGNPAAVIPLDKWYDDKLMQNIAMENNLSETAFFIKQDGKYQLRWFTPAREVDLCGHATLAAAHVILNELSDEADEVKFETRSGLLIVKKENDYLVMNFPAIKSSPVSDDSDLSWLISLKPKEILTSKQDLLVVLESQKQIVDYVPDVINIKNLKHRGLIITAKGIDVDFVSRTFYPELAVEEDPVTGSAHCQLVPYWAKKLNKTNFIAKQLSMRGGMIKCELSNDRVLLKGTATKYLSGTIFI